MLEAIIMLLIYVCLVALALVIIVWVLKTIGVALPPEAMKIIYVIFALVVLLLILRLVLPSLTNGHLSMLQPMRSLFHA